MNGNIRLGNLFGIPFYVNISWFLVLGLVTWIYSEQLARFPQVEGITPWILGLVAALLLFASVLAHELGHSFVAKAQGIDVRSITLFLFGGLASLEKESKTPLGSFSIAIAGPIVSLLLFGLFNSINERIILPVPLNEIVSLLATINLVLATFNLIPGLPLDGGNILKAIVWQITGNPNRGVIFASRVGQLFGWLAIALGTLGIFRILPVGNLWTLLIGWFLLQNAGLTAQSAKIQEKLDRFVAKDAIVLDSPIVRADLTLREFANDYVIGKNKRDRFLVVDGWGFLQGSVAIEDLKRVPTSAWPETPVGALVQPIEKTIIVRSDLSLLEVVRTIEKQEVKAVLVANEDGAIIGTIEKASIVELLEREIQSKRN